MTFGFFSLSIARSCLAAVVVASSTRSKDVPLEECIKRDPKGLYKKALAGELQNFTGVTSPYQAPEAWEIRIDGMKESAEAAAEQITAWMLAH